jgi:hypothetical protein
MKNEMFLKNISEIRNVQNQGCAVEWLLRKKLEKFISRSRIFLYDDKPYIQLPPFVSTPAHIVQDQL